MDKPSDVTKLVLKKSKKYIIIKAICALIYRGLIMVIPILISSVVSKVTNGDYKQAIYISIAAIIVAIGYRMFEIINTYYWHKLYNSLYDNYTMIGTNKVFDNSLYSLSRFNIGEFLNIMGTDINIMADFICNLITRIIRIFEVLIIFFYFFMVDLYIGIIGIGMALIAITAIVLSSKKIEELNKKKSIKYDNRNTIINEFLLSIREIKSFNLFDTMKNRIQTSSNEYAKSYLRQRTIEDVYKYAVLSFIEICRWGSVIYSIYLIFIGHLEIGTLLIIYNYFGQLVEGFSEFACVNIGINQLKVSQNRFFELIIYSHEKLDLVNKYNFQNYDIKITDVIYGDKLNPKLKDATFNIKGHAINTISGPIDSGKEGVVELLLKLNSQHQGTISIDNIEISNIDFNSYYKLVASVNENDNFLNISIKDNLRIINDNFEQIVNICKKLGIHDEILKLKNGYDTILNSDEDNLSYNTKILLNIARIFLKNTNIMIFNEIFTNLNKKDRLIVLKELNKIKNNHTIIIIENEESTLKNADNIILLNKGKTETTGSYNKLKTNDLLREIIAK